MFVSPLPDFIWSQVLDPHRDDVFVVAAVEYGDLAVCRDNLMNAPQKIVGEFAGRRGLEWRDFHTLRVHPGEELAHTTVLASGVHRLHDQKNLPLPFRIKNPLLIRKFATQLLKNRQGFLFRLS